jgi:hypothetical protein
MKQAHKGIKTAALVAILGAWSLGHTWKGLLIYFTDDDLMNLYRAWVVPLSKLVVANLTPFTSVYRPAGAALYRTVYFWAGLNPLPFRIVAYALMMFNLWLIFRLARLLTGSTEIAALCTLIGGYHRRMMDLWTNNGTIYDILCFTFFYLAFTFYIATRHKYGNVTGRNLMGFCSLFILALNSKEMAVTLPVILLAYELIYYRPSPGGIKRWFFDRHALWIAGLMTALAIRAKTAAGGVFVGNPEYIPNLSIHQYAETTREFIRHLFFQPPDQLQAATALSIIGVVWAIALMTGNRVLLLASVMITVTPLPINFIQTRGFFAMYIPLVGWALFLATILVGARDSITRFVAKRPPLPEGTWAEERVILFLLTAWVLFSIQSHDASTPFQRDAPEQVLIRELRQDLARIRPSLPQGSKVLFLRDRFPADAWDPFYIVALTYRHPDITVDRVKSMSVGFPPPKPRDQYTLVLDYCDNRYREASSEGVCSTPPE